MRRHSRERQRQFQPIASLAVAPSGGNDELPPLAFAATLHNIFSDACTSDPDLQDVLGFRIKADVEAAKPPKVGSSILGIREAGFEGVPSIPNVTRHATPNRHDSVKFATPPTDSDDEDEVYDPRHRKRPKPGDLRPTDVRIYGTLDQLLSPDWEPPKPPSPVSFGPSASEAAEACDSFLALPQGSLQIASRPRTQPNGRRVSAQSKLEVVDDDKGRRKSVQAGSDASRSQPKRMTIVEGGPIRRASMQAGPTHRKSVMLGPGNRSSLDVPNAPRRPSMMFGGGQRRIGHASIFGGFAGFTTSRKSPDSFSSSSEGLSDDESSHNSEDKALLQELKENKVSCDWKLMLGAARDHAAARDAGIDLDESSRVRTFQDEESAKAAAAFDRFNFSAEKVPVITQPTHFDGGWRLKGGRRARSPLRPGVYVGREAPECAKLGDEQGRTLRGIPINAKPIKSGNFEPISTPSQPSKAPAIAEPVDYERPKTSGTSVWQMMLAKFEDDGKTEDSKQYDAWRKRVVDCTRTMQMEVGRFKLEDAYTQLAETGEKK